jgi:hypothetical protein
LDPILEKERKLTAEPNKRQSNIDIAVAIVASPNIDIELPTRTMLRRLREDPKLPDSSKLNEEPRREIPKILREEARRD